MDFKTVQCPICNAIDKLQCRENQSVYRCDHCKRIVRVVEKSVKFKREGKKKKHVN